jgi:hypothetical protein
LLWVVIGSFYGFQFSTLAVSGGKEIGIDIETCPYRKAVVGYAFVLVSYDP